MRAIAYERTGPAAEVLQVVELPTSDPAAGEVRVRLHTSGVNPSDVKSRAGLRSKTLAFPRVVPHSDGAGVIDAVGAGVDAARVGQRVWVWNAAWRRAFGTAAQYVTLPAAQAVRLPDGTGFDAGACFGIPALTALHAVLAYGGVAGQRVLVAGGAGAVGHYAVQFARLLGARQVIATVSSDAKARIARDAGADATVNYRDGQLLAEVAALTGGAGVDRIVEVDFAANAKADVAMLRASGGTVAVYGSGAAEMTMPFFDSILKNVELRFLMVYQLEPADRERATALLQSWLERGALQHLIAERLPLERCADAHALVESGRAVGNVVLEIA
jgi:NADPH2:quinone reductase